MLNLFKKNKSNAYVSAVGTGEIHSVDKCADPMFSQKIMGDGFIVKPTSNEVTSPVDGEVVMLFPTLHAIGLKDHEGKEYLIHIGVETVALNGEGFTSFVELNQKVTKGQLLIQADFEAIKDRIVSTDIIVIATDGRKCELKKTGKVTAGEEDVAVFRAE